MTLTVRLDPALESALDRYCAEHGVTKSLVVQQSLASYLVEPQPAEALTARSVSPLYEVFRQAGLVGAGSLGGASADKAAVRTRAAQRIRRAAP
jgi:hypothetical protein